MLQVFKITFFFISRHLGKIHKSNFLFYVQYKETKLEIISLLYGHSADYLQFVVWIAIFSIFSFCKLKLLICRNFLANKLCQIWEFESLECEGSRSWRPLLWWWTKIDTLALSSCCRCLLLILKCQSTLSTADVVSQNHISWPFTSELSAICDS